MPSLRRPAPRLSITLLSQARLTTLTDCGSNWLYGVASDARKTAATRAMMRARSTWLSTATAAQASDGRFLNFRCGCCCSAAGVAGVAVAVAWLLLLLLLLARANASAAAS